MYIYSLFALKGVITNQHYAMWTHFVQACQILYNKVITKEECQEADQKSCVGKRNVPPICIFMAIYRIVYWTMDLCTHFGAFHLSVIMESWEIAMQTMCKKYRGKPSYSLKL